MSSRPTALKGLLQTVLHPGTSDVERRNAIGRLNQLDPKLAFIDDIGKPRGVDRELPEFHPVSVWRGRLVAKDKIILEQAASIAALEKHQAQTDARLTKMVAENAALKSRLKSKPD